jgi:preprotein translocase SecE subunit
LVDFAMRDVMAVKDLFQFLRDVRNEIARVVWPHFDDFVGSTVVVFVVMTLFAIYLGSLDLVLSRLAQYIFAWYGGY